MSVNSRAMLSVSVSARIFGTNGTFTSRLFNFSQSIGAKNGWARISLKSNQKLMPNFPHFPHFKIRRISQTILSIFLQHSNENVARLRRCWARNAERLIQRFLVHFVLIFAVKWRKTEHHLEKDTAKAPPIHRSIVWLLLDYFGC